ncbi:hypothetical protein EJ04DRAFT_579180 [Polyplosphaeria fusca]|uniref:Uncharacterized protein n=1 Tax=Polyplosphaeria fusca TaxID=682080 RepID=A0A9P4QUY9_9PLEO|nr:hypothetical protein EJ04DRAFT_579180 [Polyplosphaeria fusca]
MDEKEGTANMQQVVELPSTMVEPPIPIFTHLTLGHLLAEAKNRPRALQVMLDSAKDMGIDLGATPSKPSRKPTHDVSDGEKAPKVADAMHAFSSDSPPQHTPDTPRPTPPHRSSRIFSETDALPPAVRAHMQHCPKFHGTISALSHRNYHASPPPAPSTPPLEIKNPRSRRPGPAQEIAECVAGGYDVAKDAIDEHLETINLTLDVLGREDLSDLTRSRGVAALKSYLLGLRMDLRGEMEGVGEMERRARAIGED